MTEQEANAMTDSLAIISEMRERDPFRNANPCFVIDSVSEVWRARQGRIRQLRSHFWIKSRKMSNGLIKTHYQSKRYTVVCITVRTLSQWS